MKKADTVAKLVAETVQLRRQVTLLTAAVNVRDRYIAVLTLRCSGDTSGVIIGPDEIEKALPLQIEYQHVWYGDPLGSMCIRLSAPTQAGENPGQDGAEDVPEGNFIAPE